jgi:hypothetical protein
MPKYDVHVYLEVKELICDIEADSPVDACREADRLLDLCPPPNWTGEVDGFIVDATGDPDLIDSAWYDSEYRKDV